MCWFASRLAVTMRNRNIKFFLLSLFLAGVFIQAGDLAGYARKVRPLTPRLVSSGAAQTVALSPTPIPSIEITPSQAVVTVGSPWRLSVWDDAGQMLTDATWSLSSTDLAEIVEAESGMAVQPGAGERSQHRGVWLLEPSRTGSLMLLAKAPGRLSVTARWKNAVAQAEIEIVSGSASEGGTRRWVVPAHPGFSTIYFQEAVPSAGNTPTFYAIENGGARGLWVRGLDFEGAQMWAIDGQSRLARRPCRILPMPHIPPV